MRITQNNHFKFRPMPKNIKKVTRKYTEVQLGIDTEYEFEFSVDGEYEEETNSFPEVNLRKVFANGFDITHHVSDAQRDWIESNVELFER